MVGVRSLWAHKQLQGVSTGSSSEIMEDWYEFGGVLGPFPVEKLQL